jgi:hypothetical protein
MSHRWLAPLALLLLSGCSRSPEPCASAGVCPEGQECLANRCVVAGGEPVGSDTQRRVAEPSRMVVLAADQDSGRDPLPPGVTFGAEHRGSTALFLEFPPVWRGAHEIESAFLVLEPLSGAQPSSEDVPVTAWRVRSRWDESNLSRLKRPELAPPKADGIARTAPPTPLRIDVTAIVSYLSKNPGSDFGIAVESGGGSGTGATYATGASGGRAPRLEVYTR